MQKVHKVFRDEPICTANLCVQVIVGNQNVGASRKKRDEISLQHSKHTHTHAHKH